MEKVIRLDRSGNEIPVGIYEDEEEVVLLPFPDIVRMRPGMYIGDTSVRGLHYLFYEFLRDIIDAVRADPCTAFSVILATDESLCVTDNGPGIPVNIFEKDKTCVELALTDFYFKRSGYTKLDSRYGLGMPTVNALSEWLEVTVRRDSKVYRMRFERGIAVTPLSVVGDCTPNQHGTTVTWLADKSIFARALTENGNLAYEPERIRHRLQELAYLLPGTRITFHNQRDGESPVVYHSLNGVVDFVPVLNHSKDVFPAEPIRVSGRRGDCQVEAAIQWSDATTETSRSYGNLRETIEGGTHVKGLRRAITKAVNRFALNSHIGERKLTTVIAINMPFPGFDGAGERLISPEIEGIVFSVVYAALKSRFASFES